MYQMGVIRPVVASAGALPSAQSNGTLASSCDLALGVLNSCAMMPDGGRVSAFVAGADPAACGGVLAVSDPVLVGGKLVSGADSS